MVIGVTAACGLCGVAVNLVPNTVASASLFIVFLLGIMVVGLYTAIAVAIFPTHLRFVFALNRKENRVEVEVRRSTRDTSII